METDAKASAPSRIVRVLLIAAGIVVILLLALGLLVRRALEPENVRKVVESQLTKAIGVPVTVSNVEVSLFPPRVNGSGIAIASPGGASAPSISLRGLQLEPQLEPLLSRQVVIERIELDGLAIVVRRDKEGALHFPSPGGDARQTGEPEAASPGMPSSTTPAAETAGSAAASPAPAIQVNDFQLRDSRFAIVDDASNATEGGTGAAVITGLAARARLDDRGLSLDNITARLGGSTLTGSGEASRAGYRFTIDWDTLRKDDLPALFALLGSAPPTGLGIEGSKPLHLEVSAASDRKLAVSGKLAADKLQVGGLTMTKVAAPLSLKGNELSLNPIQFTAYSATHDGRVDVNLGAAPFPWAIASTLSGLDINQFLSATSSAKDKLLGTGQLKANLRGTTAEPIATQLAGTIDVSLKNGVIKDFPLLATLSRALEITDTAGNDTKFEGFDARLLVANGVATAERLAMTMGAIALTARGTMRLDTQALALDGMASYTKQPGGREVKIPVKIKGTAASPDFTVDVKQMAATARQKAAQKAADTAKEKLSGKLRKRP